MDSSIRRWKRTKIDIRVRLRRLDLADHAGVVVRTYEMSEGGLSLYTPEPLPLDTPVQLEIALPGTGHAFSAKAQVRNRRGFRQGLEFVDIAPRDRAAIRRYLASLTVPVEF